MRNWALLLEKAEKEYMENPHPVPPLWCILGGQETYKGREVLGRSEVNFGVGGFERR